MKYKSVRVSGNIDSFQIVKGSEDKEVVRIIWDAWAGGNIIPGLTARTTNLISTTNHRNGDLTIKAPDYAWDIAYRFLPQ